MLLVRAIETEDTAAVVLTRDDRQYATAAAINSSQLSETPDPRRTAKFLANRAALALDRLIGRYPMLERARRLRRWPQLLNWTLPIAALVIGLVTNSIEGNQLNILAFPLLGMLAWNLAVYAWLFIAWIRRALGANRRSQPSNVTSWMLRPSTAQLAGHPTLERAVNRFARDWAAVADRLNQARAHRTLHLSAATFAVGIVAGMFARARYTTEYTAGWAGTWAGAEAEIAAFLRIVLAPASALTGRALPTAERLRELRGTSENAGDWLYLWIVTAALFVIVPRLLMAIGNTLQSARLARRLAIPEDFYVRRVLRDAVGGARNVRVIPYAFDLGAKAKETLRQLLADAMGDKTIVQVEASIPYGGEDEWADRQGMQLADSDQIILLFNLASTAEAENHGALASRLRQQIGDRAELVVLLDDSGFIHKLRGQVSAPRRLDERQQAWRAVLSASQIDPIRVTLDATPDPGVARALEQALLHSRTSK